MPGAGRINYQLYPEIGFALFRVGEAFDLEAYIEVVERCTADPLFDKAMDTLWDFRATSVTSMNSGDVVQLAHHSSEYTGRRGGYWKTAVLVAGDLNYGLARMFEAYVDSAPNDVMVFRDVESALKWLGREGKLTL